VQGGLLRWGRQEVRLKALEQLRMSGGCAFRLRGDDRILPIFSKSKASVMPRLPEPPVCSALRASQLRRTRRMWPAPLSLPSSYCSGREPCAPTASLAGRAKRVQTMRALCGGVMSWATASGGQRDLIPLESLHAHAGFTLCGAARRRFSGRR